MISHAAANTGHVLYNNIIRLINITQVCTHVAASILHLPTVHGVAMYSETVSPLERPTSAIA